MVFLLPLSYVIAAYSRRTAWLSCLTAILANLVSTLWLSRAAGIGFAETALDLAYFSAMSAGFTWFAISWTGDEGGEEDALPPLLYRLQPAYRLAIAAVLSAGLMLLALNVSVEGGIVALIESEAAILSQFYAAEAAGEAEAAGVTGAGAAIAGTGVGGLFGGLDPGYIARTMEALLFRGGAAAALMLLFYGSRGLGRWLHRLIRRRPRQECLALFHNASALVWVLSSSIAALMLGHWQDWEPVELAAANALVVCAVLYLAQGWGIVLALGRRSQGFARFLPALVALLIVMSPGINFIFLGILALVGIAEHWLPMGRTVV
jgi:hypothetical protein